MSACEILSIFTPTRALKRFVFVIEPDEGARYNDVTENDREGMQMGNQDQPLVTFLMPCYNSASFMDRGVDSVVSVIETLDYPCEVILVNDGSRDDTSERIHEYAAKHDCVVAVDQENANWGGVV